MKKIGLFLIILSFFSLSLVYAHQPRYVFNQENITVQNPEISQAFYGKLEGKPNYYSIGGTHDLYLNILVPDLNDSRKDFVIDIYVLDNGSWDLMRSLDGRNFTWTGFYEEFAGDKYLKGPELDASLKPRDFLVKISNSDNTGKYSLAVGKIEKFSIKDLVVLPIIKHNFFNKSYFAIFQGIIGKGLLILVIVVIALILVIMSKIKNSKRSQKQTTR